MLSIRARQWELLEDWAEQGFLARARAHVAQHFADRCTQLGPPATEALLQQALGEARAHGLQLQPQVLSYLSLVFEFGPGFPQRPEDAWARSILRDGLPDMIERLFQAGLAERRALAASERGIRPAR